MKITPSAFTTDYFEQHVDALQVALSKSFDFNTQERGKLRDVTAAVLFGAQSDYQQALPQMYQPVPMPGDVLDPAICDLDEKGRAKGSGADYWRSDKEHLVSDWQYEVENGDTRLGYWDWVESQKASSS